jgi:hypothetical protein
MGGGLLAGVFLLSSWPFPRVTGQAKTSEQCLIHEAGPQSRVFRCPSYSLDQYRLPSAFLAWDYYYYYYYKFLLGYIHYMGGANL